MAEKPSMASSRRVYASILIPAMIASIFMCGLTYYYSITERQRTMDETIMDYAEMVATMPPVVRMVGTGVTDPEVTAFLRHMEETTRQIDVLVICDSASRRYYHTDESKVGKTFVGGDQEEILQGQDPYISSAVGTLGPQRRAFFPIRSEEGTIIGFVMASVLDETIDSLRTRIFTAYLLILAVILCICFLTAQAFHSRLKKTLLGYQPEEIATMYIERAEVLDALEEGIFAINADGEVILMNQSARRMLDLPAATRTEGHQLTEYYAQTRLPNTVKTGKAEYDISFVIRDRNIISSRIPIREGDKIVGAVSIFRDKTNVTRLADQLTGANHMVETLRAFNHEFVNRLHVILGLMELREWDKARDYILNTTLVSSQAISDIQHRIPVESLAALFIGKLVKANELGITLTLKSDSYFYPKSRELPSDCWITLVGNLVENAFDELNSHDYPVKTVEVGIYSEEEHTTIVCDDTGGGIPEEILIRLYDSHTTTKGEGHGSGYHLIREIVDLYEGTIHIDTEPGEGTSVEIILPV